MVDAFVPNATKSLGIEDKEGNSVYRCVVFANSLDDAVKASRKKGYTTRPFIYNKSKWEADNSEKERLKEEVTNKNTTLNQMASDSFQELFIALMHMKIMRAYIDGVLRFGVPPRFYTGVVLPAKGAERSILHEMTDVLAEESMKEMYGEKMDAAETEDYWPFVCISLTSPMHLHTS